MTNTLRTGTMASVIAEMILRNEWKRPNNRMTRRARRTRTKPVGSLVTAMESRDMPTMKESSHDLWGGRGNLRKVSPWSSLRKATAQSF